MDPNEGTISLMISPHNPNTRMLLYKIPFLEVEVAYGVLLVKYLWENNYTELGMGIHTFKSNHVAITWSLKQRKFILYLNSLKMESEIFTNPPLNFFKY